MLIFKWSINLKIIKIEVEQRILNIKKIIVLFRGYLLVIGFCLMVFIHYLLSRKTANLFALFFEDPRNYNKIENIDHFGIH